MKYSNKKYLDQAQAFLDRTNSVIDIAESPLSKESLWNHDGKYGINYLVKISNKNGSFSFDFWGSIKDKEMVEMAQEVDKMQTNQSPQFFAIKEFITESGKKFDNKPFLRWNVTPTVKEIVKPDIYDILAALDIVQEDNFKDWCDSFGYNDDSITAEKTYRACIEQDRQLRKLFTPDELEALSEIN